MNNTVIDHYLTLIVPALFTNYLQNLLPSLPGKYDKKMTGKTV